MTFKYVYIFHFIEVPERQILVHSSYDCNSQGRHRQNQDLGIQSQFFPPGGQGVLEPSPAASWAGSKVEELGLEPGTLK